MYFPKSQITPNLYTNGGEYLYASTKEPYVGYYFKVSTGKYYTGKTPDDRPNEELIFTQVQDYPIDVRQQVITIDPSISFITNNESVNKTTFVPNYNPVVPNKQNYQIGEFRRYFCKRTNAIVYIEIDKNQYDLLKSKNDQILWQLYEGFFIPWNLTGDKQQVYKVNKNIVELTSMKKKLPKFGDYLKNDYLKYYK